MMKRKLSTGISRSFALIALFALSCPGFAQPALTAKSLEGVWKVTKIVKAGVADTNPQPALLIMTRGYFSATRVNAARKQAPPPKDAANLTDAEKIALYNEWTGFGASAGTYELKGNTVISHNMVAKMAKGMTVTEEALIEKFDGNSFVAKPTPGSPNGDRETVYTRVR
jgi:hypothetical protein